MKHLLSILAFLVPVLMSGQAVSYTGTSPNIINGVLPNGVSYYLVRNGASGPYADFALVQNGNFDTRTVGESLDRLPHFGDVKPYEYLASKGVGYSVSGLASLSPYGVVYRFRDVPVYETSVADTLLLMVFDLIQTYPSEQALVISGDISPDKILERLQTLSMIVSPREPLAGSGEAPRESCDSIIFQCKKIPSHRIARVELTYFTPRIPRPDMNTVQPLIVEMFAREAGYVAARRIEDAFREAGIPLGSVSLKYQGSGSSVTEERYSALITVDKDRLAEATELLGRVAASIDGRGIGRTEFDMAKKNLMMSARKALPDGLNSSYVDKCVSAFLFGASLAEDSDRSAFFAGRNMDPSQERKLLNGYMSSLLDRDRNIILRYSSPEYLFCRDSMVNAFHRGWDRELAEPGRWRSGIDSSKFEISSAGSKTKLKTVTDDVRSGGKLWTFANGLRVIFKKSGNDRTFNYGFLFRGGCTENGGFVKGELPFANDLLSLYDVEGMSNRDFRDYLGSKGISISARIGLSDFRVTGSAPTPSLPTLFKAMHSLSTARKFNAKAFDYYRSRQYLLFEENKRSDEGVASLMSLATYPGYEYGSHRVERYLTDRLPSKTESYLSSRLSNWSDGIIVIVGDVDEVALKDYLSKTLGSFRPGKSSRHRITAEKKLSSASTMLYDVSDSAGVGKPVPSVNISLSARLPFNLTRLAALNIAADALRSSLVRELASSGMYVRVETSCEVVPIETMGLSVNCVKCPGTGIPKGVGPADILSAVESARKAIRELVDNGMPDGEFNGLKKRYAIRAKAAGASAQAQVESIMSRISDGKDLLSGLEQAIDAVSESDVLELMKALSEGTDVEYLVE
ncbi:MAG: insulinase family protein [Bacteroidales bacterium]|nr:insulinase family protein [Bacteroidales bacterium]